MAMVLANANVVAAKTGQLSALTVGRTLLLVTSNGHGQFLWELRRWYYRDAMAPPLRRLYHRIRSCQEARVGTSEWPLHGTCYTWLLWHKILAVHPYPQSSFVPFTQ